MRSAGSASGIDDDGDGGDDVLGSVSGTDDDGDDGDVLGSDAGASVLGGVESGASVVGGALAVGLSRAASVTTPGSAEQATARNDTTPAARSARGVTGTRV
jgi:hypothetical protein